LFSQTITNFFLESKKEKEKEEKEKEGEKSTLALPTAKSTSSCHSLCLRAPFHLFELLLFTLANAVAFAYLLAPSFV